MTSKNKAKNSQECPYRIPGLQNGGVCTLTGRTLWTHPDWNVELPHYSNKLLMLDERTIYAVSSGTIHLSDTMCYCERFDRMFASVSGGKPLHLIEDWSQLRGADTSARRAYVSYHLGRRNRLASLRFFGLNGLTRLMVALGKALHVVPFLVEAYPDYPSVLTAMGIPFKKISPTKVATIGRRKRSWAIPLPAFLLRGHAARLAEIFGALPWETPGEGVNPLPDKDPFHDLVAGWIAVKSDLDNLHERARRQEANFRALMESAREGVWLSDGTGATQWANGSMAHLLGTSVSALAGRSMSEILPPTLFAEARGQTTDPIELRLPRDDGREIWAMVSAGPIPPENGEPPGIYAICTNITGRRKAEGQVRELAEALERRVLERTNELAMSNKKLGDALRSREEFLATMSHELRTPLATMLNVSESLRGGIQGTLDERQVARLRLLENNGHHLLALINDVLDLSKSLAGKLELSLSPVDLRMLSTECVHTITPFAEKKGIDLSCTVPSDPLVARVDPLRFRQILTNLLSNACKFSPSGAKAGLRLEADSAGDKIRVVVWDEGPGIAPEECEKLFQPFVQLDNRLAREHEGTGLGLALSRQLAEQHGGCILLKSELGKGAIFTFELPWIKVDEETSTSIEVASATGAISRLDTRKRSILLVEDNEDLRQTVQEYLEAAGWVVSVASGGFQALESFADEPSDIVLMDIQMPGMDGLESIRRLRSLPGGDAPKIVAMSGLAFPEDIARSKSAGADMHLPKPVRLGQLVRLLDSMIEG